MAVPRNRVSNAKKNSRRAHHAVSKKNLTACSNCSKMRQAHRICPHCGYYASNQKTYFSTESQDA